MVNLTSRSIRNDRLRILMDAIQIQMGSNGLRLVLRNASLERYLDQPPPMNRKFEIPAQDYTSVLAALRAYFGVGARSTMLRIGADAFHLKLSKNRLATSMRRLYLLGLNDKKAALWTLNWLAAEWNQPDERVVLQEAAGHLLLLDSSNDRTVGIQAEHPICWTAVGEIAEALFWGTSVRHQVQETDCIACGNESCCFSIEA